MNDKTCMCEGIGKILKICIIISVFTVLIIVGVAVFNVYNSCSETNYYLVEQHIGTIEPEYIGDLLPCNECLIMTVKRITTVQRPPNNQNITLFFATEHELRTDLKDGSDIWVNWCNTENNRFIRGVKSEP